MISRWLDTLNAEALLLLVTDEIYLITTLR